MKLVRTIRSFDSVLWDQGEIQALLDVVPNERNQNVLVSSRAQHRMSQRQKRPSLVLIQFLLSQCVVVVSSFLLHFFSSMTMMRSTAARFASRAAARAQSTRSFASAAETNVAG